MGMDDTVWTNLHNDYKKRNWIDKPSLFAESVLSYLPATGKLLDLGAGQGQDSRYFAEHGYDVVSTDLEESALEQGRTKTPDALRSKIDILQVDLRNNLPFDDAVFDVVYAHLSLHYFDKVTTTHIFDEIYRILKPGGVLAFFVNSTSDPEYNTGHRIEDDYFMIDKTAKRYFSPDTAKEFAHRFTPLLVDNDGETYKDREKGVHHLVRFVGVKS